MHCCSKSVVNDLISGGMLRNRMSMQQHPWNVSHSLVHSFTNCICLRVVGRCVTILDLGLFWHLLELQTNELSTVVMNTVLWPRTPSQPSVLKQLTNMFTAAVLLSMCVILTTSVAGSMHVRALNSASVSLILTFHGPIRWT